MLSINMPQPGTKQTLLLETSGGPAIPATFIGGHKDGPTILVVAGVHGGEYVAVQTLVDLAARIQPSEVRGRLLMLHPLNRPGFEQRVPTVLPDDGQNINSHFHPGHRPGPAAALARAVIELQQISDFYLDLHAADLFETTSPLACYPATGDERVTLASRQAAQMVAAKAMIPSTLAGAGITEAARRGLPALLIKRGGMGGTCSLDEVELYKKDVINVLKHLGSLEGEPEILTTPPREAQPIYLRANTSGLWQPRVTMGQNVIGGQIVGQITDFFGHPQEEFRAVTDGYTLYGLAALATNPGDILLVCAQNISDNR